MGESIKGLKRSHRCTEVSNKNIGEKVTLMGWVQKSRNKGSIIFTDLRDRSGIIQIIFEEGNIDDKYFKLAGTLHSEYCIAITGTVNKRNGESNPDLITGDIEVIAETIRILSESEVIPFPIERDSKTKEELRLKYRYLDLRRVDLQEKLIKRSKITASLRDFLNKEGFLEMETPILNRSTPEGARDYLVPSRVNRGQFYALPQSPQLFKQLLMCSGFDRYFQVAKCFRDEDLRADRQPEFTQLDMELSFVDVEDIIDVNERLLAHVFKDVLNIDIPLPFKRITWIEAMNRFGVDKPDLRFDMEITTIDQLVSNCGFSVFEDAIKNGGTVRGINGKGAGEISRKKLDKLVDFVKDYGAKGLAYICISNDGEIKSSFSKFLSEEKLKEIIEKMNGENGDLLLFVADKFNVTCASLGNLRNHMASEMGIIRENEYNFLWVTEFPLLEWSEEQNRFMAMHHPFTMPMEEDLEYIDTDPGRVRAKAYDCVLNGYELGGGSIRIHREEIQSKMLEVLGFTKEDAYESFGFLLDAFKYGVPPHGGLAFGLDRLCMLMTKTDNIRDVIAFPKNKDAQCLMSFAPNFVEEKQLDELFIKSTVEKQ